MARSGPLFGPEGRNHIEDVLILSHPDYETIMGEIVYMLRKTGDEPFAFASISSDLAARGINFAIVMGVKGLIEAARARLAETGYNGLN